MLQPSLNHTTRGHSLKLETQLAVGQRANFFSTRVVTHWNALSDSTVTAPNVQAFKTGLAKDWSGVAKYTYNF